MARMTEKNRGRGFQPVRNKDHGQDGHATVRIRQGASLPHWTREGGVYSVTFRLEDSLPQQIVKDWKRERGDLLNKSKDEKRELTEQEREFMRDAAGQEDAE